LYWCTKGLKPLGESLCLVHFSPKTWRKISDEVNNESFFIIQGEAKATNSQKGTPFLEVIAFSVSLKEETEKKTKEDNIPIKEIKLIDKKPIQNSSDQGSSKEMFYKWYTSEDIIYLSNNDLVLTEDSHFQARNVSLGISLEKIREHNFTMNNVIAVRPIENNKYALVMGIRGYTLAKMLNIDKVPVVIKDMSYKDFVNKYAKNPNVILNPKKTSIIPK